MTSLAQAHSALNACRSVNYINAGPVQVRTLVRGVRVLPASIAEILPARTAGWYQVLVEAVGGPAWINVSPGMVCVA